LKAPLGKGQLFEMAEASAMEGSAEMTQATTSTCDGGPSTMAKDPPLEAVLLQLRGAEAEAEWQQQQGQRRRQGTDLRSAAQHEAGASSVLRHASEPAEGTCAAAVMERHTEEKHFSVLENFSFERDWRVAELRAADVGADAASGDQQNQHSPKDGADDAEHLASLAHAVAAETDGGVDAEACAAEATAADLHRRLKGEKAALRRLAQDFHTGRSPIRRAAAQHDAQGAGRAFGEEPSQDLALAQDLEMAASAKVTRQEEDLLSQRAEPEKVRHQAVRETAGGSTADTIAEDAAATAQPPSAAAVAAAAAAASAPFVHDWRVRERRLAGTGGGSQGDPCVPLVEEHGGSAKQPETEQQQQQQEQQPQQPLLSQHEVQALQQWLVAANESAGAEADAPSSVKLAMARQNVESSGKGTAVAGNPLRRQLSQEEAAERTALGECAALGEAVAGQTQEEFQHHAQLAASRLRDGQAQMQAVRAA